MLLKMGGENSSTSKYRVYNRVEITFDVNFADCIFNPPRGKQWKTEAQYIDTNFEDIIKSYFFVAWYLKDMQDWEYHLPVFMQKQRIGSNMFLIKKSIDEYNENSVYKIEFSKFNKEWKFWSDHYVNHYYRQ